MKKKLKWKKGMQANRLTEIISRIESTRKAQAHLEALEEELDLKMILIQVSSTWEKGFQKHGDIYKLLYVFEFKNIFTINSFKLLFS